jgi:hypothetical protein
MNNMIKIIMRIGLTFIFCLVIINLYGQDSLDIQNNEYSKTLISANTNLQKKTMPDFKNRYFQCMKYIDTFNIFGVINRKFKYLNQTATTFLMTHIPQNLQIHFTS